MARDPAVLFRQVPLFAHLPGELLRSLTAHLRRRTFEKGTIVFHRGQVGDALYVVDSGRMRIFLAAEGGEEIDVDIIGPGDVVGEMALLDGLPRSASVETLEDNVTYTLSRSDFQDCLAQSPEMASALLGLLSTHCRHLMQYTESLAFCDVQARVARVLLDLAHRYGLKEGDGMLINLEMTQGELARMVGATRERVNRVLASYRSRGLLEMRGRKILVREPRRLSAQMT